MRTLLIGPACVLAVLHVACHDAGPTGLPAVPCGEVSTCPNDLPPTQSDTDLCTPQALGVCGSLYQGYHDCYADERVCAFDGTTDVLATELLCQGASDLVGACERANPPD